MLVIQVPSSMETLAVYPFSAPASNLFTTPLGIRSSGDNGIIEAYSVTPHAEVPGTV